jgi:hypothetical protein
MMNSANDRIDEAQSDATDEGYIIGTVVDNNDPIGIGRVKVSIPNLFEPGQSAVAWVGAHKQSPFGFGPNFGTYGSPQVGSQVRVKFQEGNAHYGLAEADEYKASIANPKFKDPKTWGFKDPKQNELWVNLTTGAWEFTHNSGLYLKYDSLGNSNEFVPMTKTITVDGDMTTNVAGTDLHDAPSVNTTGNLVVGTGATGSFGTTTGQTVTVADGIIISIV